MGGACTQFMKQPEQEITLEEPFLAILVKSARGLRDADKNVMYSGTSDPYCICKVGPVGSSWEDKDEKTIRQSAVIVEDTNPIWNFAFAYQEQVANKSAELHVRVFDKDHLKADDDLGFVRVPITQLLSHIGELRDYPLEGPEAQGSVSLMTGPSVEEAFLEHMQKNKGHRGETTSWWWALADSMQLYYARTSYYSQYYATMLSYLANGQIPGARALRDWAVRRATDSSGKNTYLWKGPFPENCLTYNGHQDCAEKMKALGPRLGTTNGNGECYRGNFLGFQLLNGILWPEKPDNPVIGLGENQQNHAFARALLAKLVGPPPEGRWTPELVKKMATSFWEKRTSVQSSDFKPWVMQVLHKVHLGIDLSWQEAVEFADYQFQALLIIPFPTASLQPGRKERELLKVDETLAKKAKYLDRYKVALRQILPEEVALWSEQELTLGASFVMDSLLFAGGASVPTVISYAMCLPWTHWGKENLPKDFQLKKSTVGTYIMETIRRFPPVAGFAWRERSFGGEPDKDFFCNVKMTAFDERVWREPDKFIMRSHEEYAKNSLLWAEAAMAPHNASPNSHACPAKDLSIRMAMEFVTAFLQTAMGDSTFNKDKPLDIQSWKLNPGLVVINEYGPLPSYTLEKGKK